MILKMVQQDNYDLVKQVTELDSEGTEPRI
jgi:hypothetical protein